MRKELIKQHCRVKNMLGVNLHLITEDCELYYCSDERKLPFPSPWWAFAWPGGVSLGKYLTENHQAVKNKVVLDIGSGCGITSLLAAKIGAAKVYSNDIDPFAAAALELNKEVNENIDPNVIECITDDLIFTSHDFTNYDVIICGDMLYDLAFSNQLLKVLAGHPMVIFGDPGRMGCPSNISENTLLASYPLDGGDGFHTAKVFKHI